MFFLGYRHMLFLMSSALMENSQRLLALTGSSVWPDLHGGSLGINSINTDNAAVWEKDKDMPETTTTYRRTDKKRHAFCMKLYDQNDVENHNQVQSKQL